VYRGITQFFCFGDSHVSPEQGFLSFFLLVLQFHEPHEHDDPVLHQQSPFPLQDNFDDQLIEEVATIDQHASVSVHAHHIFQHHDAYIASSLFQRRRLMNAIIEERINHVQSDLVGLISHNIS